MYKEKVKNKSQNIFMYPLHVSICIFSKNSARVEPLCILYNLYAILCIQNILYFLNMILTFLKNLLTEHEDIEIGRCIWRHTGARCTTGQDKG